MKPNVKLKRITVELLKIYVGLLKDSIKETIRLKQFIKELEDKPKHD